MGKVGDVRNLKPFNTRPKEEHLAISAKGGRTVTEKKRIAAKQRWVMKKLKEGGLKNDDVHWLMEKVQNREIFALDLLKKCEELYLTCHPMQKTAVLNVMKDVAKFTHGDKLKSENVNININTTVDEVSKRICGYMEDEENE